MSLASQSFRVRWRKSRRLYHRVMRAHIGSCDVHGSGDQRFSQTTRRSQSLLMDVGGSVDTLLSNGGRMTTDQPLKRSK